MIQGLVRVLIAAREPLIQIIVNVTSGVTVWYITKRITNKGEKHGSNETR